MPSQISIHALLAESDIQNAGACLNILISIHALLAESDQHQRMRKDGTQQFLSTLSLRRATNDAINGCNPDLISIHALLAESDYITIIIIFIALKFLSTLSLRRATYLGAGKSCDVCHFYPRSPCGERRVKMELDRTASNFYPRSPCGERHNKPTQRAE